MFRSESFYECMMVLIEDALDGFQKEYQYQDDCNKSSQIHDFARIVEILKLAFSFVKRQLLIDIDNYDYLIDYVSKLSLLNSLV